MPSAPIGRPWMMPMNSVLTRYTWAWHDWGSATSTRDVVRRPSAIVAVTDSVAGGERHRDGGVAAAAGIEACRSPTSRLSMVETVGR